MKTITLGRRAFLGSGAATGIALASQKGAAAAATTADGSYEFEVQLTEAEWRDRLSDVEYAILREGATEPPKSSALWNEERPGTYCCRACQLLLYHGKWKVVLEIGWAFFRHAEPLSVLVGIDGTEEMVEATGDQPDVEAICRRCGSHLGHIVSIDDEVLHCINGHALEFEPETA